jgi:hypothetical protein
VDFPYCASGRLIRYDPCLFVAKIWQFVSIIDPKWELQPINSYALRAAPRSSSASASLDHARSDLVESFLCRSRRRKQSRVYQGGDVGLADGGARRVLLKTSRMHDG